MRVEGAKGQVARPGPSFPWVWLVVAAHAGAGTQGAPSRQQGPRLAGWNVQVDERASLETESLT
jgi:hypothetical protein